MSDFNCENCIHREVCPGYQVTMPDCKQYKDEARFIELPCKVGDTVWVSPNNGKSFHTGKLFGKNERGSHLVFVTDTVTDFVSQPLNRFFYDWFFRVYTREEAEQALKEANKVV